MDGSKKLNRIKAVLAEAGHTGLATELGKDPVTASKWCTNRAQPSLDVLFQVAQKLNVEVKDLIREVNNLTQSL